MPTTMVISHTFITVTLTLITMFSKHHEYAEELLQLITLLVRSGTGESCLDPPLALGKNLSQDKGREASNDRETPYSLCGKLRLTGFLLTKPLRWNLQAASHTRSLGRNPERPSKAPGFCFAREALVLPEPQANLPSKAISDLRLNSNPSCSELRIHQNSELTTPEY